MTVSAVSLQQMLFQNNRPGTPSSGDHALDVQQLRALRAGLPFCDALPVVLCIGTDRIIGDCLGPLTGSALLKAAKDRLPVYGSMQQTVHALNLQDTIRQIKKKHPNRCIIAVDASLGSCDQIGSIFVRPGRLRPGAGVHKSLPEVGDIAIVGIANNKTGLPWMDLQTARLSTVYRMAETVSSCILQACL